MKIQHVSIPFSFFVIDDFYDEAELDLVMQEVIALKPYSLDQSKTSSATDNDKPLKTGTGIFLDQMFAVDRSVSKILNANRKIFDTKLTTELVSRDPSFGHIARSTSDSTLLNYYVDQEEYLSHKDLAVISAVTFLQVGEFTGGAFAFPEYEIEIPFKHNRLVMFHSCMEHYAKKIESNTDGYRASIANFISYK